MARRDSKGRFLKGHAKRGGRQRGTPNRATRAWKDFVTALVEDPENQDALAEAIKARPELLFKAAEHAVGRPRQAHEVVESEGLADIFLRAHELANERRRAEALSKNADPHRGREVG